MEKIEIDNICYAIIIRANFEYDGIKFFTPDDYSQQLAYMKRDKGYMIEPHYHNKVDRNVSLTQEVLFIKSGSVKVNFFDENCRFQSYVILSAGDVILLASGGHGFEMMADAEIIEVKQGPYCGEKDKTRFLPQD
jgi:hypothetical protein